MKSTLNIHWKDWYWSWSSNTLATWCEESTHWKRPWCWKDWRQEEKGVTEDEIVGWHLWLNGHEFEQALGDDEGQGSLGCCRPWGRKELDTTEQLKNSKVSGYGVYVGILWWTKAFSKRKSMDAEKDHGGLYVCFASDNTTLVLNHPVHFSEMCPWI